MTKIVFVENVKNEPTYENYKEYMIAMLDAADELRTGLPFAKDITVQEVLEKDLYKTMGLILGFSATREVDLDIDIYPEYEFNSMTDDTLEKFFSEKEDLIQMVQGKLVMSVGKYKDGFIVTAFDKQYNEKLKEHAATFNTQVDLSKFHPSKESDKEIIEAIRNTM